MTTPDRPSVEERIDAAVADFRTVWPEPWPLAPNLALAVEAMEKGLATSQWASEVSDDADRYHLQGERLMEIVETARAVLTQMEARIRDSAVTEEEFHGAAADLRKALEVGD